jgi:hypothetical protein
MDMAWHLLGGAERHTARQADLCPLRICIASPNRYKCWVSENTANSVRFLEPFCRLRFPIQQALPSAAPVDSDSERTQERQLRTMTTRPETPAKPGGILPDTELSHLASREELEELEEALRHSRRLTRRQADLMLAVNAEVGSDEPNPEWRGVFVDALTAHFLSDSRSPGVLDDPEARFLMSCVMADNSVNATELGLLAQIVATAVRTPEFFKQFVMAAIGERVRRAGRVTAGAVDMLAKAMYGRGGHQGVKTSREEADFLMELNRAVAGQPNHPSWRKFLTGAVLWHILHDPASPGVVVDAEAGWLLEKINAMPELDENMRVLIDQLRAKARALPDYLERVLAERHPPAA